MTCIQQDRPFVFFLRASAVVASFLVFSFVSLTQVFAQAGVLPGEIVQTNPKDRPVEVTASVPPQGAPPAPILIEPTNNSLHRSGKLTFRWEAVEHISALDRYELYVNGSLLYGPIHITNQETDDYILTYDAANQEYRLQLKPSATLPDGVYTWKIRVIDVNDRGTDSTTWTFTVDSTPPPIVVTEIDEVPYAISASDPSTYPSEPIVVHDRSPLLKGNSESNSELEIVVRYPDGTIWQTYSTTVAGNGTFQVQLGTLPVDIVMSITLTAIDPAQNTSVLDAISLVYRPREIVIPIPDIFPFPLTIRVRIPGQIIEIPEIPVPGFPGQPSPEPTPSLEPREKPTVSPRPEKTPTPTQQVFHRPVQPVSWLVLAVFFALGWYLAALFWITGAAFSWFVHFLRQVLRMWLLLGNVDPQWQVWREDTVQPLPWFAFQARALTRQQSTHWQKQGATTPDGVGRSVFPSNALIHLQSKSKRFVYSVDRVAVYSPLSEAGEGVLPAGWYVLDGVDWMYTSQAAQPQQTTEETVFVPEGSRVILAAQAVESELVARWLTCLPQVGLVLGTLSAFWLAYQVPTWWSFVLLALILWIDLRDAMVQVRKKMLAYAKK